MCEGHKFDMCYRRHSHFTSYQQSPTRPMKSAQVKKCITLAREPTVTHTQLKTGTICEVKAYDVTAPVFQRPRALCMYCSSSPQCSKHCPLISFCSEVVCIFSHREFLLVVHCRLECSVQLHPFPISAERMFILFSASSVRHSC